MTNKIFAVAVAAMTVGAFASAAMAEGPKASSENYIPSAAGAPSSTYNPAMLGPKASSENRIGPTAPVTVAAAQPATGAQHWVYQQGYEKGTWRWHWTLVR